MLLEGNFKGCHSQTIQEIYEKTSTMPLLEGSHLPSSGLMEFEVVPAIEGMGATPDLYNFTEGREQRHHLKLEQIIYPYVESGIPVMVNIVTEGEGHSIVVIGHTFDKDSWWQRAEIGSYPTLAGGTTWIPSYMSITILVQDDNFGPFLAAPRTLLGFSTRSIVIVTVPHECHVFLAGFQAESLAANAIVSNEFYKYILQSQNIRLWRKLIENLLTSGNIVLRPMLLSKDQFLQHVKIVGLSEETSKIYQSISLQRGYG